MYLVISCWVSIRIHITFSKAGILIIYWSSLPTCNSWTKPTIFPCPMVANIRAGIRPEVSRSSWFRRMNWRQRTSLQKEQWPMVESVLLVLNVSLFCQVNQWGRESVCPARKICEEEAERAFARPFKLSGKVIRVGWLKSSSLDENIKSKPQRPK